MGAHTRMKAEGITRDQPAASTAIVPDRKVVALVVGKGGLGFLMLFRQRHPGLDTVQMVALAPRALEALRVSYAATGRHPVDLARSDRLFRANAVAVHDLAREQIGDRRQADMLVRPHVDRAGHARRHVHRTHMIEEDEGADHAPLSVRQHPSDLEPTEVTSALRNHKLDHVPSPRELCSALVLSPFPEMIFHGGTAIRWRWWRGVRSPGFLLQ